jgi:hypothetical protein
MKATLGRIVHYTLTATDVELINYNRPRWAKGQPEMMRNAVQVGGVLPAVVVAVFGDGEHVNLSVWLDGYGTYWATSRPEGTTPGTWAWPPRI